MVLQFQILNWLNLFDFFPQNNKFSYFKSWHFTLNRPPGDLFWLFLWRLPVPVRGRSSREAEPKFRKSIEKNKLSFPIKSFRYFMHQRVDLCRVVNNQFPHFSSEIKTVFVWLGPFYFFLLLPYKFPQKVYENCQINQKMCF